MKHLYSWVRPAHEPAPLLMEPKYLDPEAVAVVLDGIPETTALLAQKWALIFFTGRRTMCARILRR